LFPLLLIYNTTILPLERSGVLPDAFLIFRAKLKEIKGKSSQVVSTFGDNTFGNVSNLNV